MCNYHNYVITVIIVYTCNNRYTKASFTFHRERIMVSHRLTEEEVHTACSEISAQGERPTSLTLLDKIGRGSLTTITKYLNTWHISDEAQALKIDSLPVMVQLPDELSKDGEDLIKKVWNVAKGIADKELDTQREVLKQAETANQLKVEEAFKFSEAQAMKIERLEDDFISMKNQLDEKHKDYRQAADNLNMSEKTNVGLSKDNEQLQHELDSLQQQLNTVAQQNKILTQEKNTVQKECADLIKQKDQEIKTLEIELVKVNEKLTSSVTTNNKLSADLNDKTAECSSLIVDFSKSTSNHGITLSELDASKKESQVLNQNSLNAIKEVEHLKGQLAVFKLFKENETKKKGLSSKQANK